MLPCHSYISGGGYEPEVHYSQWKRLNQPIERRQVFHDSLIKLIEGIDGLSLTLKVPNAKTVEFANCIDPEELAQNKPTHLDLHCLSSSL